jgi:hypothetical protein
MASQDDSSGQGISAPEQETTDSNSAALMTHTSPAYLPEEKEPPLLLEVHIRLNVWGEFCRVTKRLGYGG